jgi:hypothetical protein
MAPLSLPETFVNTRSPLPRKRCKPLRQRPKATLIGLGLALAGEALFAAVFLSGCAPRPGYPIPEPLRGSAQGDERQETELILPAVPVPLVSAECNKTRVISLALRTNDNPITNALLLRIPNSPERQRYAAYLLNAALGLANSNATTPNLVVTSDSHSTNNDSCKWFLDADPVAHCTNCHALKIGDRILTFGGPNNVCKHSWERVTLQNWAQCWRQLDNQFNISREWQPPKSPIKAN